MPDNAFRQVRATDSERNIVSRIIDRQGVEGGRGRKKAGTVRLAIGHMCAPRFRGSATASAGDEISAENAPGHSDFMSLYPLKRITGLVRLAIKTVVARGDLNFPGTSR